MEDLDKRQMKRQIIIDSLCTGIVNTSDFIDDINYLIDKRMCDLSDVLYNISIYDGEDDKIIDLILPTYRKVWSSVYINIPTYFEYTSRDRDETLKLYQIMFNADDFFDHFIEVIDKTRGSFERFDYIDKTVTHVSVIADDYICYLIDRVLNCKDVKMEIRNAKLKQINRSK
jgi:hypothetical protein